MNNYADLLPIARNLEYWIDSSSTYVDDDDDDDVDDGDDDHTRQQECTGGGAVDCSGCLLKRKVPAGREGNKSQDVFLELGPRDSICKHSPLAQAHKVLIFPRSYQHHRIQKWLKKQILEQGFELKKNFQCPPSRCTDDPLQTAALRDLNWISYRYMRLSSAGKQVMCRFCHGRNWVSTSNFFKHLFLAHGIMTQVRPSYASNFHVETFKITDYFTVNIQTIQSVEFTRNLLPFLEVSLVPIPEKKFSKVLNNGFRRTHVICPHCSRWIRLGWCEYDEIIKQDFEDFDSFRNFNIENYSKISYVQKRDRDSIEGLYENYFIHYIECDFTKFQSKYLYVQII